MGIVAGPVMALSAMFAVFIYSRYDLTAAQHSEILAELEKRTVDENATG
jgi:Na+/melibiose symporter-like transporter